MPAETPPPASDPSDLPFEAALEELELIAERLESEEGSLEASVASYERGMRLMQRCRQLLDRAERTIAIISQEADGRVVTRSEDLATFERPGRGPSEEPPDA